METKDWILLIVPIVFDGLLLFCIQRIIDGKFKKIEEVRNRRNRTEEKFYSVFEIVKENFVKMCSTMRSQASGDEIENSMNTFCNSLNVLYGVCQSNNYVLEKHSTIVKEIMQKYADMIIYIKIHFGDKQEINTYATQKAGEIEKCLQELDKLYYN